MKTKLLSIYLILFTHVWAQEVLDSDQIDYAKREEMAQECQNNKEFLKLNFTTTCELNYHHYNSAASKKNYRKDNVLKKQKVKIAEFNALHPGMSKTLFKDYKKVAHIINHYDVVGVVELIPLVANDADNNIAIIDFIKSAPAEIKADKAELKKLQQEQAVKYSVVKKRTIELLRLKIAQMSKDLKEAKKLYRAPGYLKILQELHKLKNGHEWSLILSPRGEAAITSPTEELVGYYYRSSMVKPRINKYCKEVRQFGKSTPVACIVEMGTKSFEQDKKHVFSRRPFLAEFTSGKFNFTLVTSHIIFDSPSDEAVMESIVRSAFGVASYEDLGVGVQKNTYARFAEVKVTLDFINNYISNNPNSDIIFMGDFNLESDNKFWPEVLSAWPGSKLYVTDKTSTNQARYNKDGEPTNAVTSNYDHFIFDPQVTSECVNANGEITGGAFDFQKGAFARFIDQTYKVRTEEKISENEYAVDPVLYQKAVDRFVSPYLDQNKPAIKTIGSITHRYQDQFTMRSKGIIASTKEIDFYAEEFKRRVLDGQMYDESYYYFYEQVISDHLPVYMECANN